MIVTGGASGIGIETVRALASAGADVTIAARRVDAAEPVAVALRSATGNARISVRPLDLADLASVRAFVRDWDRPVHALINNAGVMCIPRLSGPARGMRCSSSPTISAISR